MSSSLQECKTLRVRGIVACDAKVGSISDLQGNPIGGFTVAANGGSQLEVKSGDTLDFKSDSLDIEVTPGSVVVSVETKIPGVFLARGGINDDTLDALGGTLWNPFNANETWYIEEDDIDETLAPITFPPYGLQSHVLPFDLKRVYMTVTVDRDSAPIAFGILRCQMFDSFFNKVGSPVDLDFGSQLIGTSVGGYIDMVLDTPWPANQTFYLAFQQTPTDSLWTIAITAYAS